MDYDELMAYIEEIMAEKCSQDDVVDAFNLIDEDGSGEVSHEEVLVVQLSDFVVLFVVLDNLDPYTV